MSLKIVNSKNAPAPIGPYSQAVRAGGFLFCSGQIPLDPKSGEIKLFDGDVAKQTQLVMNNIKAVLSAEGLAFSSIVKTTIFLSDMAHFGKVNEVYSTFMGEHRPARSCVAAKGLPKGVDVEVEAVAVCR